MIKFWCISLFLIIVMAGLAACGANPGTPEPSPTDVSEASAQEADELQKVILGVGFIPNVQFAPLYVAQSKGFYADEGLEVEIEYGFENDFVALAAQGEREFAIASGDQVILARAQDLPIIYIMKWYQRYPVALMAPATEGVSQPADLAGKKVGLPGFFGATFIGWEALVYAADLDVSNITVEEIGFTQAAAVEQGMVDAAMVYTVNEPILLRNQGIEVDVIEVSDYIDLVSNGLVVGEKLMTENPDLVRRMTQATLRGLKDTIANPDDAFAIVREVIPEITDEDAPTQRQVLDASIESWQSDNPGFSDPQAWQASVDFMSKTGLIDKTIQVDALYTNEFVEAR